MSINRLRTSVEGTSVKDLNPHSVKDLNPDSVKSLRYLK